jgi:predicted ArsR family transcriptional regulator
MDYAERTVRNHLSKLYSREDIQKTTKPSAGEQGRSPEVYHLSDIFNIELEDYLNKKEMRLGYLATLAIR